MPLRHPSKTPVLRSVERGSESSYWGGIVVELIRTDKLCYVVTLFTLAIVVLHSYGVDVLPYAHRARAESAVTTATAPPPHE